MVSVTKGGESVEFTANERSCVALDIVERSRIWRVTVDGRFYGDYVKEDWAVDAAREEAHRLRKHGAAAKVRIIDAKTNNIRVINV